MGCGTGESSTSVDGDGVGGRNDSSAQGVPKDTEPGPQDAVVDADINGPDTMADAESSAHDSTADAQADVQDAMADASAASRPFHMGMTSWPYAATIQAVQHTQALVEKHGDLYAIWLDNGLPWAAASTDGPYPQPVIDKLSELSAEFPADRQRYVSVGLLDLMRTNLATDWEGAERTGMFSDVDFGDPIVLTAYGHWLDLVIEHLSPDWFNFAIEFSDLAHHSPESWGDGAELVCALYQGLKTRHPDLNVFFSVALKHPDSETSDILATALPDVENCTDFAAASTYAFMFYGHEEAGNPDNLPDTWLSQIQDLIADKPVVVAETAWPAEDLNIEIWNISTASTPEFQKRYMERLLAEAAALDAVVVTWWCAVDFDQIWETVLNSDPLASIWRDTGLYDADLNPRPALETWEHWLALPHPSDGETDAPNP